MENITQERLFQPHTQFELVSARYSVKILNSISELKAVVDLRSKVFGEEYDVQGLKNKMDIDEFDFVCDHLIIKDNRTGKLVGTYRILCSEFTNRFYSAKEFELDEFMASPGIKLELGRACVDKEHRKGSVLSLLWRGVIQYAIRTNSSYLFGCSSVKTESYINALNIQEAFLRDGVLGTEWKVSPKGDYYFNESDKNKLEHDPDFQIPSLLKSYLSAGAKVYGLPAYDREFHCLDYLTILKLDEMKNSFEKRYKNEG